MAAVTQALEAEAAAFTQRTALQDPSVSQEEHIQDILSHEEPAPA
jgi:hypothetical protein